MKMPVASFTMLNTWGICPHQAARRYIVKDLPREEKSKEQLLGTAAHEALERRVGQDKVSLPEAMEQWEQFCAPLDAFDFQPELKLGMTAAGHACDFFAPDVFLRGVADVPIERDNGAMLLDWKTGGSKYEDPYELEVQALLLNARSNNLLQILGRYVWLKEMRVGQPHDCSRTDRTWKRVCAAMEDVQTACERERFLKTKGPLCGWCPVTDCEHNKRGKK